MDSRLRGNDEFWETNCCRLTSIPTSRYVIIMSSRTAFPAQRPNARIRLLEAARDIIRARGFAATSVDQLCAAAGVTKGAFFHHFESKEALGVAAADYWSETTSALFAAADYHNHADPLDRILAYIDFRHTLIQGGIEEFTCVVGTMVQETYQSSEAIRAACNASISGHAATLEDDIAAAMALYGARDGMSAQSLALHTQAVLQGGFILAKAQNDPSLARDTIVHLKRYIMMLFDKKEK
jgi:TetR/AcrR family transcriptional regulator, transcriptional repressor for nem operon